MNYNERRFQRDFNAPIAVIDGQLILLDYVFDTLAINGFHGATGSILRPVSRDEYEYATDFENLAEQYEDVWREVVASGGEYRSLDDFIEDAITHDGEDHLAYPDRVYDGREDEYRDILGLDEDEAVFFELIGCGRIFGQGLLGEFNAERGDRVVNEGLWRLAFLYDDEPFILPQVAGQVGQRVV